MDSNNRKKNIAMEYVIKRYLPENGYVDIRDVSTRKKGKEENGYDVVAVNKEGQKVKIEVKGSQKDYGIPDCFGTEFEDQNRIKADFFYIVRINEEYNPYRLDIVSKSEFDRYSSLHKVKPVLKISSTLKKDLKDGKIGVKIPAT